MVEIPESLRILFTATVTERNGRYRIEIPQAEVDHGVVTPGNTYRIGVFTAPEPAPDRTAHHQADHQPVDATATGAANEPPVNQGEVRNVMIETVGDQGDGIAKVERGYVVIVPDAQPGEEVTVKIDEARENVAVASVVDRDPRAR